MDVLVLIDKLDDLVHNAKAVPLTDQVRIDREEIYDILDQMRATIPEEIKQARWIVKERQEMLAEAKREVDRLLAEAREQAVREASQTEIVKIAERQADERGERPVVVGAEDDVQVRNPASEETLRLVGAPPTDQRELRDLAQRGRRLERSELRLRRDEQDVGILQQLGPLERAFAQRKVG